MSYSVCGVATMCATSRNLQGCLASTMHLKFPTEYHGHLSPPSSSSKYVSWPFLNFRIFSCTVCFLSPACRSSSEDYHSSGLLGLLFSLFWHVFNFFLVSLTIWGVCLFWYNFEGKSGPDVWYVVDEIRTPRHFTFAAQCWQASSMSGRP